MSLQESTFVKSCLAAKQLGCHPNTLKRWESKGLIETIRTSGNQRLYNVEKFIREQNTKYTPKESRLNKEKIIYCRVSCSKQKSDLERQISYLSNKYPDHKVYKEIASGINFKRVQLYRILDLCFQGTVEEIVVSHRDRLCRIAFDHFSYLFNKLQVNLVVDSEDKKDSSPNEELADDLMSIVHVFSCRHYGSRRRNSKKEIDGNENKDNL